MQVTQTVSNSLQPLADAKGLPLAAALPDVSVIVRSDARALGQILINLVNNAIKFTDGRRGRVSIDQTADGRPRVVVTDTGPGIDAEDLARIFNAFERGLLKTARHAEGTGSGLHICRKLAELIGAEITVDIDARPAAARSRSSSRSGLVPADDRSDSVVEDRANATAAGGQPIRVFLLDDHEIVRRGIADLLCGPGRHSGSRRGRDRGGGAAAHPGRAPDVAVLDARLPDGSGIEVCRMVRDLDRDPLPDPDLVRRRRGDVRCGAGGRLGIRAQADPGRRT